MNVQRIVSLVLRAVAMAMGVAAAVFGILGNASVNSLATVLGIGLFCLGLWALQQNQ